MSAARYLYLFTCHIIGADEAPLALAFDHAPTAEEIVSKMADITRLNFHAMVSVMADELDGMPSAAGLSGRFDAAEARGGFPGIVSLGMNGKAVLAIQRTRAP